MLGTTIAIVGKTPFFEGKRLGTELCKIFLFTEIDLNLSHKKGSYRNFVGRFPKKINNPTRTN